MFTARRRIAAVALAALSALSMSATPCAGSEELEPALPSPVPISYRGRKVVIDFTRHGPHVSSMSVLCQPGGGERRELHATRGVFVSDGASSWQYLPERGVVLKRPLGGEGGEVLRREQVQRALVSYTVRSISAAQVAGRPSRSLEFLPRQSGTRPRRLVWIDEETGLILRTEVYGTDSRLSWLSVFEQLEYRPQLEATTFKMSVPAGVPVVEAGAEPCLEPAVAEQLTGLPVVLPGYLPQGFERQCIQARRRRDYGEVQVIFGDGLTLLSLFASTGFSETAADPSTPAVTVGHAEGRWHDLGLVTGISWRAPWAYMALLGELSREELHRVAGSVQRDGGRSASPAGR